MADTRRKSRFVFLAYAALLLVPLGINPASAQLRGHGGPVRALAISPDGQTAISGSFDSTAIRWSLARGAAEQVLRFHADAVNAVALLRDGRAATAGADGRIAIWTPGKTEPDAVLEGHTAPIVALALSPDGATLASASWDQTVRLWPLAGGTPRVLEGPYPKRQRRCVRSRRPHAGQRQLRSERPDLAAGRYGLADRGDDAELRSTPLRSPATARSRPAAPTARYISSTSAARLPVKSQPGRGR